MISWHDMTWSGEYPRVYHEYHFYYVYYPHSTTPTVLHALLVVSTEVDRIAGGALLRLRHSRQCKSFGRSREIAAWLKYSIIGISVKVEEIGYRGLGTVLILAIKQCALNFVNPCWCVMICLPTAFCPTPSLPHRTSFSFRDCFVVTMNNIACRIGLSLTTHAWQCERIAAPYSSKRTASG